MTQVAGCGITRHCERNMAIHDDWNQTITGLPRFARNDGLSGGRVNISFKNEIK